MFYLQSIVKTENVSNKSEIKIPTAEKNSIPNNIGKSEKQKAIIETIFKTLLPLRLITYINEIKSKIQESIAVINGPMFAYPNGTKLKYEMLEYEVIE